MGPYIFIVVLGLYRTSRISYLDFAILSPFCRYFAISSLFVAILSLYGRYFGRYFSLFSSLFADRPSALELETDAIIFFDFQPAIRGL